MVGGGDEWRSRAIPKIFRVGKEGRDAVVVDVDAPLLSKATALGVALLVASITMLLLFLRGDSQNG